MGGQKRPWFVLVLLVSTHDGEATVPAFTTMDGVPSHGINISCDTSLV